tara:strand:+ start:331 stop:612 length:282 start_codon:yes stop_codon:yes gene_type:complete
MNPYFDKAKTEILMVTYLRGHGGSEMSRFMRRLIARSELHRAWLVGSLGYFEEGGVTYGPCNPYPGITFEPDDTDEAQQVIPDDVFPTYPAQL